MPIAGYYAEGRHRKGFTILTDYFKKRAMISINEYILPTFYNGITYRSRTEARWARFFDAAGIRFGYEVEGFLLNSGKYLPDFELYFYPGETTYVEVKGAFSVKEVNKCKNLCEVTQKCVLMPEGPPDFRTYEVFMWQNASAYKTDAILLSRDSKYFPFYWNGCSEHYEPDLFGKAHMSAIHAAQNERFNVFA